MEGEVKHNCGVILTHTLHDTYSGLRAEENRGREGTGIAAIGEERIDVLKFVGPPRMFSVDDLHYIFPAKDYHTYIGHLRYATRGLKSNPLEEAHPHTIGGQFLNRGNHALVLDCDMAIVHNGQIDQKYLSSIKRKDLRTTCDSEAFLHLYREIGEKEILRRVPGAYTAIIADKKRKEVITIRDRTGIKPGVLGWKDGKFGVASEDIVFREVGGEFISDLSPGSVYYFTPEGNYNEERVVSARAKHCFFEWNYISRVESMLNGVGVDTVRKNLGKELAREFGTLGADFITYTPRCPKKAAVEHARETGLELVNLFYKLKSERSFQGPNAEERKTSIKENLFLLPRLENGMRTEDFVRGKVVLIDDDSTIRGNNSTRSRDLVIKAGAKEVISVNYTPLLCGFGSDGIKRGCSFGVDMPPMPANGDLYVSRTGERNASFEEIRQKMGMKVYFLSTEGMFRAFRNSGISKNNLCTFCIGGEHPFSSFE